MSKIRPFEVLVLPSVTVYFLAVVLFIVIIVVPFGMSSIPRSRKSLFKDSVINRVFIGEGPSVTEPKWETLPAPILAYYFISWILFTD